ncbi:transglutaminase-like domain-containing protein [Kineosporia succinea]|uniref:Transglutaminase-like domain-containing protein n=1 Tax=Kineosporia succinea TaxID=84632 RepID=A0ABT9PE04_9ACTN|nr:transglutaminase domain-containing protein [Kineosporia succinea]MDP9830929.1 hypothetical protein [Kineosporia succinea]
MKVGAPRGAVDHVRQSSYSRPGRHAPLLTNAISGEGHLVQRLSMLARNVIVHYRASGESLPGATAGDIHLRRLEDILETDQSRHGSPLTAPRKITERVQGCCRDHTLFCVGALRQLGVPARSRVGFATYLSPTWNHDHVIVEVWMEGRWRRFDPEIADPFDALPTPMDIPAGPGAPFLSAAQVWLGHRDGSLDAARFGVAEGSPLAGDWFVFNYVIDEVAHRFGDELLLWDLWGAKVNDVSRARPGDLDLIDHVARLLLASDEGDQQAEHDLLALYTEDARLHPGRSIARSGQRIAVTDDRPAGSAAQERVSGIPGVRRVGHDDPGGCLSRSR